MDFYEPPVPMFEEVYSWSGGYVGEVITLNKEGEFIFHSWTDIIDDSVVYYSGSYNSTDSLINFEVRNKHTRKRLFKHLPGYRTTTGSISNSEDILSIFDEPFYIVHWDNLKYIIPNSEISTFIKSVNRQDEPEVIQPTYFLLCCNNELPDSLFPEVPKKYESKLNKTIADIIVTEIKTDSTFAVEISEKLNIRSGQNLFDNRLVYHVMNGNEIMIYDKNRSYFRNILNDEITFGDHIVLTIENLEKYDINVGKNIRAKLP